MSQLQDGPFVIEDGSVQEVSEGDSKTKKLGAAWRFCFDKDKSFVKNDGKYYLRCSMCQKEFTFNKNTTTNLDRHVKNEHSYLLKGSGSGNKKQTSMTEFNTHKDLPVFSQEGFKEYLVRLIVTADLSFLLLENEEFRNYSRYLNRDIKLIKADQLRNWILDKSKTIKVKMIEYFSKIDSRISFTTDIWTSPNNKSFMAITAHWISPDFQMKSILMDFVHLDGKHSGANIEKYFSSSLKEFKVFKKRFAITLDNASNNDTFLAAFQKTDPSFKKEHRIRCFGHVLNLCAQDALDVVSGELSALRDYINLIKNSTLRLDQLKRDFKSAKEESDDLESYGKTAEQLGFVMPELDSKTRWNSTVDMLQKAFRLQDGLFQTMDSIYHEYSKKKNNDDKFVQISKDKWEELRCIANMLEPLKEVTELVSGETYPTLSKIVPFYNLILDHFERLTKDQNKFIKEASMKAYEKLKKYYDISSELCTIATVLDPRLRLEYYDEGSEDVEDVEDVKEIRKQVKTVYEKCYVPVSNADIPTQKKFKTNCENVIYGKKRSPQKQPSEFDEYVKESTSDHDPLQYWKNNSARFPNLSRMARDYLAIPGTSTPSERAFSKGRHLISDFRCSLAPETITACMLLKSWYKVNDDVNLS